ncbi:MAG: PAS domain-containing protein, partial [Anaerolineae bacterium]|nr:PAS domain-containing protein [Anaerolineae bacterium]
MSSLLAGRRWRISFWVLSVLLIALLNAPPIASAQEQAAAAVAQAVAAAVAAASSPAEAGPGGLLWAICVLVGLVGAAGSNDAGSEGAGGGNAGGCGSDDAGGSDSLPGEFDDCIARVFDQAPVGMALLNGENRLVRFNSAFADLLGYEHPALCQQPFTLLLHPDDRESFMYLKQEILEGHASSSRIEMRCLHHNGHIVWVRAAFSSASGDDPAHPLLLIYLDDYSVQKEMEQAFWEQILRNEMILQTASDGFCLFGLDGTIMEVNAAFAAITGYPQEFMTGMPVSNLQEDDHQPAIIDQVSQVLETGSRRFETTIRRQDGSTAALAASLNLIDMGSQRFLFLSIRDVTEMHTAQQALRESQQMLQLVLDAIPTRVFWKDRQLRFLGCNRAFAEDAGLKDQRAIVGMTDYEMPWKAQAQAYRAADLRVIENEEQFTDLEEPQQRLDGNRYWLRTNKLPLRDPDGSIVGVMGTYEDVTERKQAHDRLEQSENRLQSIFNNAAAGILLLDAEGNFLHFN